MANNNPAHIVLKNVRISYEHLNAPYAQNPGQEPKYSATILVPKSSAENRAKIDAAIAAAIERARAKFGNAFPATPKVSVHDGDGVRPSDGQPFGEECHGCWIFTASSKQRPEVVDVNVQPILNPAEIYSGMYANVGVTFFGYNAPQNKGVGVGLETVQKIADGEPLGNGRASAEDDFTPVEAGLPGTGYQQPPQQYAAPVGYPQPAQTYGAPTAAPSSYPQPAQQYDGNAYPQQW